MRMFITSRCTEPTIPCSYGSEIQEVVSEYNTFCSLLPSKKCREPRTINMDSIPTLNVIPADLTWCTITAYFAETRYTMRNKLQIYKSRPSAFFHRWKYAYYFNYMVKENTQFLSEDLAFWNVGGHHSVLINLRSEHLVSSRM